jgi:DNA-binding MarR family transcriptional regulator
MTGRISIELTGAQVDRVMRDAGHEQDLAGLLRGLDADGSLAARYLALAASPRLSRSLMLGLLVFAAMPRDGDTLAVTDVASKLDMSPSTTHRYMTTLLALGLLEQDPRSRRYRLALEGQQQPARPRAQRAES